MLTESYYGFIYFYYIFVSFSLSTKINKLKNNLNN